MDIRCRKCNCKYNDNFTCKARNVQIDKNVCCENYEKDLGKKSEDTSLKLFSKTPKYALQRDIKKANIVCDCDCLFNHNGRCVSNGITVNDIDKKAYCISYFKK